METPPGKVIRSLRQALDMTQAEFARAAGWSTSTISSWERGTTTPSRLAFKTILAFAEERGVRYQPKAEASGTAAGSGTLPVLRLSSRLATPMVLDAEYGPSPAGAREESFGSRRWSAVAASRPTVEVHGGSLAERPEWQVEAQLNIRIGAGNERLRRTGIAAVSVVALALGLGAGMLVRTGVGSHPAPRSLERPATEPAAAAPASAPESAPPVEVDELSLAALAAAPLPGPPLAVGQAPTADVAPDVPQPAMPPPSFARLESIVALDGTRRATFRVGDRAIALVEGDAIAGREVALIENQAVTLVRDGVAKRVRLGVETPLD